VIHGSEIGTKRPPSGAYPANNASSNVYSPPPPLVDLYFIGRLELAARRIAESKCCTIRPAKKLRLRNFSPGVGTRYDGTLIEGMGAGQSKQQLAKPSSSSLSATSSENSPDSSIKNAKEESGGCPMKNADGTYRTMPGFASLFGAKHPPVAGNAVVVAAVPEKRIDLSTSSRPATTAEIDQRSIPAWFVSFSAG